jgi:RNA polymerase sigma-70 factor (ECF subfamily)
MTAAGEVLVGTPVAQRWPADLVDCYSHHAEPLTGYVVSLVGDVALAQDVVQESFVRLFARWRHVEHPRAYVYLTAVNLARRHWRRLGYEAAALQAVGRLNDDRAAATDPWLRDLVERLPSRLRVPVLLHYYADLPIDEVCAVMNTPSGTVKRRLHEARQLLREILERTDA